ncbi:pectinesterase family protein [Flavimaricola marinus]|uniref:pectinesterase family protein n=1 Tax=Flavimaricola marinus TaxID=1819565 RepID=UPI0014557C25|nr:pectinesterase family protein [Flavimaricola marinus]
MTPAQAEAFSRDAVLRHTGRAGADRADPWVPERLSLPFSPDYVVGRGHHRTVQAAVNSAIRDGRTGRVVIGVEPGVHEGLIHVPPLPFPITLAGLGRRPEQTVLKASIDAEMPGAEFATRFEAHVSDAPEAVLSIVRRIAAQDKITTANASVLRIECDGFQLHNLTVRNGYQADRAQDGAHRRNAAGQFTTGQHQAVAVLVDGADRVQLQDVHLRSFQDTLYLQSPTKGTTVRTHLSGCDIEGDVDFIFGQSTAWFDGCTIRSLGTRAPECWVAAPATDIRTRYGFVFHDCDFVHDGSALAQRRQMRLGRQWFEGVRATPYGHPTVAGYRCDLAETSAYTPPLGTISRATLESVGKCVILRSRIGRHIDLTTPWDSWSGRNWGPRYRPALYTAGDMMAQLGGWLARQRIRYDDIDPDMVFLSEFENQWSDPGPSG